jgi:MFS family permease
MSVIGLVLSVFGLGFLCWLLFTFAVYALPFFAGLTVGLAAFYSGSGFIGALVVGIFVGSATLAIGQMAFATFRRPLIRGSIGLLYAVSATIAGYHASLGLAEIGVPAEGWRMAFALSGAVLIGVTAFARMALAPPRVGWRPVEKPAPSPFGLPLRDRMRVASGHPRRRGLHRSGR